MFKGCENSQYIVAQEKSSIKVNKKIAKYQKLHAKYFHFEYMKNDKTWKKCY